jgi:glycine/D-amino acid oxidase-like deaminating enzyme
MQLKKLLLIALVLISYRSVQAQSYDIVIYGGTSAGVAAAIQSSRLGKSVILIEPSSHVGGLTTGGLGATDIGNKQAAGMLADGKLCAAWEKVYENLGEGNPLLIREYPTLHAMVGAEDFVATSLALYADCHAWVRGAQEGSQ